jgi:multidrug efflux pump
MLQLHSFSRAMLVFLTGPLGIAGVAGRCCCWVGRLALWRLLGVIALMGMIQRNSVILIDQIEQDRSRRAGLGRHCGVGGAPLAPIVLTAAAAVLAMIPLSRSVFWGPMAVAIMGGLIVATVLTCWHCPPCTRPGSGSKKRRPRQVKISVDRKFHAGGSCTPVPRVPPLCVLRGWRNW